jgi:peptide/nickel transport system permease protein
MINYLIRRILIFIPTMIVLTLLVFIGVELGPGDVASYMIDPEMGSDMIERIREELGLNKPWPVRYMSWLREITRGNWGYSLVDGAPIKDLLATRIPRTLKLMSIAFIAAIVFGVGFGVISALHQYSFIDHTLTFTGLLGISIPVFFVGLVGIFIFSLRLKILPIGGTASGADLLSRLKVMILPAGVLALRNGAEFLRYARGSMLDALHKDYIGLAKSKGIPPWRVTYLHGLRTALIPVVMIIFLRFPILVGGSVIIEQVFSWPGIGTMLIIAAESRDYPVVMAVALIIAASIMVASLLADIVLALIDPRVRFE